MITNAPHSAAPEVEHPGGDGPRRTLDLQDMLREARGAAKTVRDAVLTDERAFQMYLRWHARRLGLHGVPEAPWHNAALQSTRESEAAAMQARILGLPAHPDTPKNWDSLAALDAILKHCTRDAFIVDGGAEIYSVILPWLFLYGYTHLTGINPIFQRPVNRGPIHYENGDVTATRFADSSVDALTCLSVIEHGVDLCGYFQEAARILKPGGILITSTDYYSEPIDTHGLSAYGVPIHVFSAEEIRAAVRLAGEYGLQLTSPLDLHATEKPVRWARFGLDYTFVTFTLQRVA